MPIYAIELCKNKESFLDFSAFFWYVVYMNIKSTRKDSSLTSAGFRLESISAVAENQMGAAYVDSQLKWEFDRLELAKLNRTCQARLAMQAVV